MYKHQHHNQHRLSTFAIAALAACLFIGCSKTPAPDKTAPAAAVKAVDPFLVEIKPEMAKSFKIESLVQKEVAQTQEISGRIDTNESLLTRIGASVTGRVTEVVSELGQSVATGQTLARIASAELTTAQLAYLRANASTSLAERALDRAKQLIQADVIGSAELQRREAELAISKAELRASSDQLKLMGVPAAAIGRLTDQGTLSATASVLTTQSGVVTERKVSQGQVVQPGDHLFTVADLSSVWVIGAVPEQTARSVQVGQKMDITVPALGNRTLTGKVIFISDTISPETRSVTVRTQVDNPKRELKPQMLATLRISSASISTLVVPTAAVVRESDKDHVYVQTGVNRFRLTPVELGAATNGFRPVLKGAEAGTPIVTDGAFHLNNERKRSELE
jgi:cobalt-zinc-cadmium efflux system membrane fusion protein